MNEIKIQIAGSGDIPELNHVNMMHYSCQPIHFSPINIEASDVVQSEINIIFIAKLHSEIIGYLRLHSSASFNHNYNEAEFEIVVNTENRKQKVGKKLLEHAIQHAVKKTKFNCINAKMKSGNEASKRLCKSCGFHELCVGSNGFTMILKIDRKNITGD